MQDPALSRQSVHESSGPEVPGTGVAGRINQTRLADKVGRSEFGT
jgi:hypothetical protein